MSTAKRLLFLLLPTALFAAMSAPPGASIYSQPANTGAGRLENTQLASAVESLKYEQNPIRMEDFALGLGSGFEALLDAQSSLYRRFLAHERVVLNPVNGTLTYRPDYALNSKADLLQLIRDRWDAHFPADAPRGAKRLPLKPVIRMTDLRESWPDVRQAVETLTKHEPQEDREVLVWKQTRDGAVRGVAWNPIRGAEAKAPEEEFKELWHSLKTPDELDLQKQLEADGLRMTGILPGADGAASSSMAANAAAASNVPLSAFGTKGMIHGDKGTPVGRGGARGRGGRGRGVAFGRGGAAATTSSRKPKIQNTHLEGVDLSKDYV